MAGQFNDGDMLVRFYADGWRAAWRQGAVTHVSDPRDSPETAVMDVRQKVIEKQTAPQFVAGDLDPA